MNLLKDNVPKLVRTLALPAMVGTLFQTLYNIVDTFFAGKISPEALSALSKSFPIYFIIVATSIGVTVAGTALIGNSIGEKDKNKTLNYFTHIIFIFFTNAVPNQCCTSNSNSNRCSYYNKIDRKRFAQC